MIQDDLCIEDHNKVVGRPSRSQYFYGMGNIAAIITALYTILPSMRSGSPVVWKTESLKCFDQYLDMKYDTSIKWLNGQKNKPKEIPLYKDLILIY